MYFKIADFSNIPTNHYLFERKLKKLLASDQFNKVHIIVAALEKQNDQYAVGLLIKSLIDHGGDAVIAPLGNIAHSSHRQSEHRLWAAEGLGKFGHCDAIDDLLQLLDCKPLPDADGYFRGFNHELPGAAALALGKIVSRHPHHARVPQIIEQLEYAALDTAKADGHTARSARAALHELDSQRINCFPGKQAYEKTAGDRVDETAGFFLKLGKLLKKRHSFSA